MEEEAVAAVMVEVAVAKVGVMAKASWVEEEEVARLVLAILLLVVVVLLAAAAVAVVVVRKQKGQQRSFRGTTHRRFSLIIIIR